METEASLLLEISGVYVLWLDLKKFMQLAVSTLVITCSPITYASDLVTGAGSSFIALSFINGLLLTIVNLAKNKLSVNGSGAGIKASRRQNC